MKQDGVLFLYYGLGIAITIIVLLLLLLLQGIACAIALLISYIKEGRWITRETREGRTEDPQEKNDETERRDAEKKSIYKGLPCDK